MKYQFLCATHRVQLSNHPDQALRCWRNSYEAGQSLLELGYDYEALPHLGCAFEVAEIILSKQILDTIDAIALLTVSTAALAKSLNKRGYRKQKDAVLQLTHRRLMQEQASYPEYAAVIQHQIHALDHACEVSTLPGQDEQLSTAELNIQAYLDSEPARVCH